MDIKEVCEYICDCPRETCDLVQEILENSCPNDCDNCPYTRICIH